MSKRPTPKKVILGLLHAGKNRPLSVRNAIRACSLFDLTENNVRVTLVRLSSDGLILSPERGMYVLGPAAQEMAGDLSGWRSSQDRLQDWSGQWHMLLSGSALSTDRGEKKRRLRAIAMTGMRELQPGAWVRPDNLAGGVEALRERLWRLGLPRDTLVFQAAELDADSDANARRLWPARELTDAYQQQARFLQEWLERWPAMDPEEAARESYLYGAEAIRRVVFDPWLPAELVDAEARAAFFQTVLEFDQTGQRIWQDMFDRNTAMPMDTGSSL